MTRPSRANGANRESLQGFTRSADLLAGLEPRARRGQGALVQALSGTPWQDEVAQHDDEGAMLQIGLSLTPMFDGDVATGSPDSSSSPRG